MNRWGPAAAIAAGAAVLVVGVYGSFLLRGRPGLPDAASIRASLWASGHAAPAGAAVQVFAIDGVRLRTDSESAAKFDTEFLLRGRRPGDPVRLRVRSGVIAAEIEAAVVPFYASGQTGLFLACGLFAGLIGIGVLLLRRDSLRARVFCALSLAFAAAVMINGDIYGYDGRLRSLLPGVLFNFAYPLAPALLLRFARTFAPRAKRPRPAWLIAPGLIIGGLLNFGYLRVILAGDFGAHRLRHDLFFLLRGYMIVFLAAAFAALALGFRRSASGEERAQLKWIFLGLAAGLGPFILLYQVPQILGFGPLFSEEISSLFFFLIPPAVAISIVRHRLMDVDVVVNRGVVYSALTVLTASVYLLVLEVLHRSLSGMAPAGDRLLPLAAAVLAAVALQGSRNRVQTMVDKAFFRHAYDYRRTIHRFSSGAPKRMGYAELFSFLSAELGTALPLERLGLVVAAGRPDGSSEVLFRSGLEKAAAGGREAVLLALPSGVYGRTGAVRFNDGVDESADRALSAAGYDVAVALPFQEARIRGVLAAGRKRSGERFGTDDLELLSTLANELAACVERLRLQEEVVYERATREKLDELNRMKTEFISEVSHELRTPLTSIHGMSEMLRSGAAADAAKRDRWLDMLESECARLSRFLHNVLDFGRIERETRTYVLRRACLRPLVREAADFALARGRGSALVVDVKVPDEAAEVDMDADAVRQALTNLLDNAVKYSGEVKRVGIDLVNGPDTVEVRVSDAGIGIAAEDRVRIFESFYRAPEAVRQDPKGVGLGLKIVKHVMDAHGGRVAVSGQPGQGSVFTLVFPKP